jgi:hypothetical protein
MCDFSDLMNSMVLVMNVELNRTEVASWARGDLECGNWKDSGWQV